ncbi:MAG TPA: heavy metal-associated domain-containing protein, partial [Cyclobacteriaceae bacterium]
MKHTYIISGMSCEGCRSKVESTLRRVEGVTGVSVDLQKGEASIKMSSHIPLEKFQEAMKNAGGHYGISLPGKPGKMHMDHDHHSQPKDHQVAPAQKPQGGSSGVYYCPMHCEGDKT